LFATFEEEKRVEMKMISLKGNLGWEDRKDNCASKKSLGLTKPTPKSSSYVRIKIL
jgi:hypothetical protein